MDNAEIEKRLLELEKECLEVANAIKAIRDDLDAEEEKKVQPELPFEEEKKPAIPLEKVRSVLAGKSRDGHTAEVRELIAKYGATRLSEIDPEHFEAILQEAEGIGNA